MSEIPPVDEPRSTSIADRLFNRQLHEELAEAYQDIRQNPRPTATTALVGTKCPRDVAVRFQCDPGDETDETRTPSEN